MAERNDELAFLQARDLSPATIFDAGGNLDESCTTVFDYEYAGISESLDKRR